MASSVTEMDLQASESLLEDFRQRSRRFRRRVRRRVRNLVENPVEAPAGEDVVEVQANEEVDNVEPGFAQDSDGEDVDLNAAIQDDADVNGAGDDDDWSFDRIDEARRLDFLEQILLKENHQFHLHC